jgi:hypothetical protein
MIEPTLTNCINHNQRSSSLPSFKFHLNARSNNISDPNKTIEDASSDATTTSNNNLLNNNRFSVASQPVLTATSITPINITIITIISICDTYEKRMRAYMNSIAHIPPTQFELNHKHLEQKKEAISQLMVKMDDEHEDFANNSLKQQELVTNVEQIFQQLGRENHEENRRCQMGFVLGWKCQKGK